MASAADNPKNPEKKPTNLQLHQAPTALQVKHLQHLPAAEPLLLHKLSLK